MEFYLGSCNPGDLQKTNVPLMVSRRRLVRFKTLPIPCASWVLDSGAFSELSLHGRWTVSAMQYSSEVRKFSQQMGGLKWAAAQDWMCEPFITEKTGFSVLEHQRRTVENYILLKQIACDLPWVPVLQGFTEDEYWRCVEMYGERGVDLRELPLVGLGSVCRRQATGMVEDLIVQLNGYGIRLHGFGFKIDGLRRCSRWLESADSMAWSYDARRSEPLSGCRHRSCSNCLKYALKWRKEKVMPAIRFGKQAGSVFELVFK